jgi:hypothetical protein
MSRSKIGISGNTDSGKKSAIERWGRFVSEQGDLRSMAIASNKTMLAIAMQTPVHLKT